MASEKLLRGLIMGCPGSGKGTQTGRILNHFKQNLLSCSNVVSSGDCLREHINHKTTVGKAVEEILARGELVPDTIVSPMMLDKVKGMLHKSWLLDGFPRTVKQAKKLDQLLETEGKPINFVIDLAVPHRVILKRIEDRWIHAPSGRVYNLSFNPPKTPGLDDLTGEQLSKRPDDNLIIFKKRLEKYTESTRPLIEYYKRKGVLYQFKGETSDIITPQIIQALSSFFTKST